MRLFCRNRNLPPNNAGQSSKKLGSLVNHLNRVDNKYINILGELECMLVSTMEKASKLCARRMKLHMYESNPAKQIMNHCGNVLTIIGRLRVDFKNESLLDNAEHELLGLEKEAYKLASHKNCCINVEGIHIITDTGICIALLGRLRRAQLKYDPEDDLPEAVCMCDYVDGCGNGCGTTPSNNYQVPPTPALSPVLSPSPQLSLPQQTGCTNCTCGCNNGNVCNCANMFSLFNKKLVFRHEYSIVAGESESGTVNLHINEEVDPSESVEDNESKVDIENVSMPPEHLLNDEVEKVKPVPRPVVVIDDNQEIEKPSCPACRDN